MQKLSVSIGILGYDEHDEEHKPKLKTADWTREIWGVSVGNSDGHRRVLGPKESMDLFTNRIESLKITDFQLDAQGEFLVLPIPEAKRISDLETVHFGGQVRNVQGHTAQGLIIDTVAGDDKLQAAMKKKKGNATIEVVTFTKPLGFTYLEADKELEVYVNGVKNVIEPMESGDKKQTAGFFLSTQPIRELKISNLNEDEGVRVAAKLWSK